MEMSKIFYIVLIFCCFSAAAFGQYDKNEISVSFFDGSEIIEEILDNPDATSLKFSFYQFAHDSSKDDPAFPYVKLPEKIPYHPNIKELSFEICDLYNLRDWSDSLPNVETVKIIMGEFNSPADDIERPGKYIFKMFKNYKKLKSFQLYDPDFHPALYGVGQLEKLEELVLSDYAVQEISEDVIKLKKLKSVEFTASRELTIKDFEILAKVKTLERFYYTCRDTLSNEGIYLLQQIDTLELGWKFADISQFDINSFPNLRSVSFHIKSVDDIPESFTKAKYIRSMDIYYWFRKTIEINRKEEIKETEKIYEKFKNVDAEIEIIPISL